jgi:hypothetical protein
MARRHQEGDARRIDRVGGINIERSSVTAGGDIVGGNKTTLSGEDQQLDALFAQLATAIQTSRTVPIEDRDELSRKSNELKEELVKPEPDLGRVASLKNLLVSKGDAIATAVAAIFQYPPVQDTLKVLTQRLLGS